MSAQHTHGCCADKACSDKTCMALPAGKTCGDCAHLRHCIAFYARTPADTYCDFFPRRFAERAVASTSLPPPHPAPVAAPAPAARAAGPFNAPLTLSAGRGEAA